MEAVVERKENCYGCTACSQICPHSAINMVKDGEGFLYSEIDQKACIDCKLCRKVCPYYSNTASTNECAQRYYAVQHRDRDVVAKSTSGGIFTALSDYILNRHGVVYGVAYEEGFVIAHNRAEDASARDRFCRSKYVQSNMKSVMSSILTDLCEGRRVMFTGTPCQVAGVRNYVLQKHKNLNGLFLCDFICHGVASPAVWRQYVDFLEERYKISLTTYHFRSKDSGWHANLPKIVMGDTNVSNDFQKKQSFFLLYATCYINRLCCYQCKYASYQRQSDITIGDFWNIGKIAPEMDDDTGTSQVLINTKRGQEWFEGCRDSIKLLECTKEDVWQPHLEYPNELPRGRIKFWEDFQSLPFGQVIQKYGKGSLVSKCKSIGVPIVKKLGLYTFAGKAYRWLFVRKGQKS